MSSDYKDPHLIFQKALWSNNIVKDVFAYMGINSTKWVIQKVDVSIEIYSSCHAYTLLLASTQCNSL